MGIDDIFDLDGDGKLNAIERATAYEVLFKNRDSKDNGGFHSSFDDDEDLMEAYDEYEEYEEDEIVDDEYDGDDEEGEEDLFNWDEDDKDGSELDEASRKAWASYRERLGKIIELINKVTSDSDDLLYDLEMDLADVDEKYEMIDALENAKVDLDLLAVDLENILE